MNKIKMVEVICNEGCYSRAEVGNRGVEKIIDNTANDMGFNVIGEGGKLMKTILNCSVEVTYF